MGQLTIAGNAKSRGISNVDPRLLAIIASAAAKSPYNVQVFSGVRYGSAKGSRHNTGNAVDIVLSTPDGKKIPNNKSSVGFPIYQDFAKVARQEQQALHPELSNDFRWGGYFAGGKGKYGAIDLMHFDLKKNAPMGGGSWEEGLTEAQAKIVAKMGPGEVYSADGIWNYSGERMLPSLFGRGGLIDSALEKSGLAGHEVAAPGMALPPTRPMQPAVSPSDLARQYGGQQPMPAPVGPVERGAMLAQPQAPVSDMARAYGGQQPIAAPVTPVQSSPLGPTPGMMQQQYAQYRPTPNVKPQNLSPVSSQEIASRVSAAQAPSSSGALTPSIIARFAAGAQAPSPTPSAQPQQISAASPQTRINPAQPPYGYATPVSPTPTLQAKPNYSPAPAAPSGPAISPAQPNYAPVTTPTPQTLNPATPKYETVKVVSYPTLNPVEHVGGIGSDPDRNMAHPMTLAEQYAAYRPAPNLAPYKPAEEKKPEPVVAYKKVPIPTVNDARKVGTVAPALVQQQTLPSVPAPLMANGEDRTPKYFQPKYGLGWAGGMVGGMLGGPLGKMAGKYAGRYLASQLSRTDLPTPENFAGYGLGAIQGIQNGIAAPSSYAQARNNANGYMTQWSNTGPGGAAVQTTSTPGGTTYSTWQQYGPSPMTMVTYGASGSNPPKSSSSTTGGYTTTTGNLY